MQSKFSPEVIEKVKRGGIGVIPTDTIYGVVASALDKHAVEKLRKIRGRADDKPFIVLISHLSDLKMLGVFPESHIEEILNKVWPGSVSVILPCEDEKFEYLTRGTKTLAVRLPGEEELRELVRQTGPLVAPSVNSPGEFPSKNIKEAKKYFPKLDFYVDAGVLEGKASTLIGFENGRVKILRQGAGIIPQGFLA